MKVYRRHYCERHHRTFEGTFAVVSRCRGFTVSLWETQAEAEVSKAFIDRTHCGGRCIGADGHEIILLRMDA